MREREQAGKAFAQAAAAVARASGVPRCASTAGHGGLDRHLWCRDHSSQEERVLGRSWEGFSAMAAWRALAQVRPSALLPSLPYCSDSSACVSSGWVEAGCRHDLYRRRRRWPPLLQQRSARALLLAGGLGAAHLHACMGHDCGRCSHLCCAARLPLADRPLRPASWPTRARGSSVARWVEAVRAPSQALCCDIQPCSQH